MSLQNYKRRETRTSIQLDHQTGERGYAKRSMLMIPAPTKRHRVKTKQRRKRLGITEGVKLKDDGHSRHVRRQTTSSQRNIIGESRQTTTADPERIERKLKMKKRMPSARDHRERDSSFFQQRKRA
jgi:hypothetical protein